MIDSKVLRDIDDMLEVQLSSVQDDVSGEYMKGMYNGMEFVRAMMTNTEPVYVEKDGTLDEEAKERNPERYI